MAKDFKHNGRPLAPGNGPVRIKKRAGFFESLVGVLVGLGLIIGSPFVLWHVASQDNAGDFMTAKVVESSSPVEGYVVVIDSPEYIDANGGSDCYQENCIHEVASYQELVTNTELICSDSIKESATVRVVGTNGVECDDETGECVTCYDVEKDTWEEYDSDTLDYNVKLGLYTVEVGSGAIYLNTKEQIDETDWDDDDYPIARTVYTTFVLPRKLLVAGQSDGTFLSQPTEKPMVISQLDHEGTFVALEAGDKTARWMLRTVTFVMLFVGFSMMFGPIEWAARMFGKIPAIGPMVRGGSRFTISALSFMLAVVLWIIEWVLIALLQNLWIVLAVVVAMGLVIFILEKKEVINIAK